MGSGNDWNWIVAGFASAAVLVGLTLGGSFPFLVSLIVAALVFGGLTLLLAPRRLFEGLDLRSLAGSRVAFARELLEGAQPAAARLEAAARKIPDKKVSAEVKRLAGIAADVIAKIEAKPADAAGVKRFLSYYLPRAADVAEGYATLAARRAPDGRRLEEVGAVIAKLQDAFVHYADSLADDQLGTLDVDLRLIRQSLRDDLGA